MLHCFLFSSLKLRQIMSPYFSTVLYSSGCVNERITDEWRLPTFIFVSLVHPSYPFHLHVSVCLYNSLPMLFFCSLKANTATHLPVSSSTCHTEIKPIIRYWIPLHPGTLQYSTEVDLLSEVWHTDCTDCVPLFSIRVNTLRVDPH